MTTPSKPSPSRNHEALEALRYALNVALSEEWNLGELSIPEGDKRAHVGLIAVRKMRAAISALETAIASETKQPEKQPRGSFFCKEWGGSQQDPCDQQCEICANIDADPEPSYDKNDGPCTDTELCRVGWLVRENRIKHLEAELAARSANRQCEAPPGMRFELVEKYDAQTQPHVAGELFGLRIVNGCSNGCAEIWVEDDGNWHFKMRFDRSWLKDLADVIRRAEGTKASG